MEIKVERLERAVIGVKNLDEGVKFFTDLLGIKFTVILHKEVSRMLTVTEHTDGSTEKLRMQPSKLAVSLTGLSLV